MFCFGGERRTLFGLDWVLIISAWVAVSIFFFSCLFSFFVQNENKHFPPPNVFFWEWFFFGGRCWVVLSVVVMASSVCVPTHQTKDNNDWLNDGWNKPELTQKNKPYTHRHTPTVPNSDSPNSHPTQSCNRDQSPWKACKRYLILGARFWSTLYVRMTALAFFFLSTRPHKATNPRG